MRGHLYRTDSTRPPLLSLFICKSEHERRDYKARAQNEDIGLHQDDKTRNKCDMNQKTDDLIMDDNVNNTSECNENTNTQEDGICSKWSKYVTLNVREMLVAAILIFAVIVITSVTEILIGMTLAMSSPLSLLGPL